MPLIVDTNVAADFFFSASSPYARVRADVHSGRCLVHYGGSRHISEISRDHRVRREYLKLSRAGRCRRLDTATVDRAQPGFSAICSDDPHLLAVARIGGARLLCTRDRDLIADFTNPTVLSPQGRVYPYSSVPTNKTHLRLASSCY